MENNKPTLKSYIIVFSTFAILIAIIFCLIKFVSPKILLLSTGIFSLLMYFNISLTTLANSFIGRDINPNYDIFWKIVFMICSSVTLGIYFNI